MFGRLWTEGLQRLKKFSSKLLGGEASEEGLARLSPDSSKSLSGYEKTIVELIPEEYIHSVEVEIDGTRKTSEGTVRQEPRD
jgi:hypothetical protein